MISYRFRRSYVGGLQAILLDWAGTTMDYGCYAPAVVFVEVFRRRGVDITMAEAREPMGAHKKVHIRKISKIPRVAAAWESACGRACTEQDVEAMFEDFVPLQLDCLTDYADLIPGTLEAVEKFRARGLKIGSTTGFTNEMMDLLLREAKQRGYEPDVSVCATDVPAGRPAPWMCLTNAMRLDVWPMEALVKVGDTLPDIEEGLNAGMWTIGLALTGNEMGMKKDEIAQLDRERREQLLERARSRLLMTGAHYIVDSISDVDPLLDDINKRLARGERP
jgi:phosphonoacetaldehyde hydrolase